MIHSYASSYDPCTRWCQDPLRAHSAHYYLFSHYYHEHNDATSSTHNSQSTVNTTFTTCINYLLLAQLFHQALRHCLEEHMPFNLSIDINYHPCSHAALPRCARASNYDNDSSAVHQPQHLST
eukprot:1420920-Amphidinium_carterae.9